MLQPVEGKGTQGHVHTLGCAHFGLLGSKVGGGGSLSCTTSPFKKKMCDRITHNKTYIINTYIMICAYILTINFLYIHIYIGNKKAVTAKEWIWMANKKHHETFTRWEEKAAQLW